MTDVEKEIIVFTLIFLRLFPFIFQRNPEKIGGNLKKPSGAVKDSFV